MVSAQVRGYDTLALVGEEVQALESDRLRPIVFLPSALDQGRVEIDAEDRDLAPWQALAQVLVQL